MLPIVMLGIGLGIGTYLPIKQEYLPLIGMVVMAFNPVTTLMSVMLFAGYLIASFIKSSFIEDVKELGLIEAISECREFMFSFCTGTFIFAIMEGNAATSFVFILMSLFQMLIWVYIDINAGYKKGTIRKIIGFGIMYYMAKYTIDTISKMSIFGYFLGIMTIPSLILNRNSKNSKTPKGSFANAFTYGVSYSGPGYTGIVLAQTIMSGSMKDTLGTIINSNVGALLDPYRLIWALAILAFIWLFINYIIQTICPRSNSLDLDITNNNALIETVILTSSIYTVIAFLGLPHALLIVGLGFLVNIILPKNYVKMFSVPTLLICGITG